MKQWIPRVPRLLPPEAGATPAQQAIMPSAGPEQVSLRRRVLQMAVWPMLEQLMAFLVGFVDTALAGHLPSSQAADASSAIGAAGYVVWLMGLLHGSIGIGAAAIIARAIGAKRNRLARESLGQAMVLGAIWGLGGAFLFWFSAEFWGRWVHLEGAALDWCTQYLRILALAMPAMALLHVANAALRAAGDFRTPFFVMIVVNAVNIGVSVLGVHGPQPWGGHGVLGIAVGTAIAWVVGAWLVLSRLSRPQSPLRLLMHRLKPHGRMIRRIVRVGIPALVENILFWGGNFAVLIMVGRLHEAHPVGAHMIAIRIEAFSFLPGFALSMAASTLVGQALGAGDPALARRAAWTCLGYAATIMGGLGLVFLLFPQFLVRMVTSEPIFLEKVPPLLFYAGWAQIGFATAMVFGGTLRGAGDTRTALTLTLISTYLIRLPLVCWVVLVEQGDLAAVWSMICFELSLRGILFMARFIQGGWVNVKV